ncbi:hypothetical protein QFC22_006616 [Naganishia vaughanmartiniae]|uniref:Uncharacterized protein n=1 Tax=Naganishia vaughanmartiniae TaxID=1424756 RepID=A0ACC2WI41_9TREE|nr:hypothetical protein QFC22_006616 [Naganishia vaughanmartiniae]
MQQHHQSQPQSQRTPSYAFTAGREMIQGTSMDQGVGKTPFYAEGMQQGAPMSRTSSLRPEDAGKEGYPSISPTGQIPNQQQQVALVEDQNAHRPSLNPIQHSQHPWNSDNSMASNPQSPHSSMEMMRSNSSSAAQMRRRPAPLNLQTGSHGLKSSHSSEHLKVELSPYDPTFRSASAMSASPYGHAYQQHQAHRLQSAPNMSSPTVQTTQSGFYGATHVGSYSYQQMQQSQQPQQPQQQQQPFSSHYPASQPTSGGAYPFPSQLPSMQHYVQPYNGRPLSAMPTSYGMHQSSYLQAGQPSQMPPLTHMAHSAPSSIPQHSSATMAAYHEYQQQQRPHLSHTFSSMTSGGSFSDRPEYTGFSSYPIQRGQDRPHKCDQCSQSFNRNHDLKRHKRIHLEVKPFACSACRKQFSRRDALTRHWLVKKCEGFDMNPNNPEYTPPSGANRKNAAAIPRHYQNLSKKALQAKVERQQQQLDQGIESNQGSGSKDSDSGSDGSKSESDKEDEPMEVKMQPGQLGGPYANLPSIPALSPPTPQMSTAPQYTEQGGQNMTRSASHNVILVTPDESSNHIPPPRLSQKSHSSPFLATHSQTVYSHLIPEKSIHPNGQHSNYDGNSQPRQMIPQYPTLPDVVDPSKASTPNSGAISGQFVWQQQNGNYTLNSTATSIPVASADRPAGQLQHTIPEESMRSTEIVVSQINPYVKVSAASPAMPSILPKPTRNSKDYFDGIGFPDKSVPTSMEVDPTASSANVSFHQALPAQNSDAIQRPVFTMPFGSSKADQPIPEIATTETLQMSGQWQRW